MEFFDIIQNAAGTVWLAHILLIPLYLILGTAKHEYAHAWAAKRQGLTVLEIQLFPCKRNGNFYWGYVRWQGIDPAKPFVYLLPYYVDIVLLVAGIAMIWGIVPMTWWAEHHHEFFAASIVGLALPIFDIGYNFIKWVAFGKGDLWEVFGKTE